MDNATNRLLDRISAQYKVTSTYGLAKLLDGVPSLVRNYRKGVSQMDDFIAVRAAELLSEDPALILAEIHADRCKSMEARKHWYRIANMLRADAETHAAA